MAEVRYDSSILNGKVSTRPPRRRKPFTLAAVLSNFLRDLRYYLRYKWEN